MPDFTFEQRCGGLICGLDEVGRAPLAGPVTAACVVVMPDHRNAPVWKEVRDSKKLSRQGREALVGDIQQNCFYAVGEACPREIEDLNIIQASFLAMRRAFDLLQKQIDTPLQSALIDGHMTTNLPCPAQSIIKGDDKSVTIAAASILAKIDRDRYMDTLAEEFPYYGWETNAGYATKAHIDGINKHGITDHHRRSFAPVRDYMTYGNTNRQMKFAI